MLCAITQMQNLKILNQLVTVAKEKQTHRQREHSSGYQWRGEGVKWYKLLNIK